MYKNIVIAVLILISLSSVTFGFYQKALAEAARNEATLAAEQARRAQLEAEELRAMRMELERLAVEKEVELARLKKK